MLTLIQMLKFFKKQGLSKQEALAEIVIILEFGEGPFELSIEQKTRARKVCEDENKLKSALATWDIL